MKKASLVINPENGGFKEIYEIEGSEQRFYPSRGTKIPVKVRYIRDIEMTEAFLKLGVSYENYEGKDLLGEVLRSAICKGDNNIAWDCCGNEGYMVFKYIE